MGQTTFSGPVVSQNGFIENSFTTAQRNAIVDPTAGLLIYNTTTNAYEVYNGTGWQDAFAPPTTTYTANVDYASMGGSSGVVANSQDPDPDTLTIRPGYWFNSNWNNVILTPVGTQFTIVVNGVSYTGTQTGAWVSGPGQYQAAMNWPVEFSSSYIISSITF